MWALTKRKTVYAKNNEPIELVGSGKLNIKETRTGSSIT